MGVRRGARLRLSGTVPRAGGIDGDGEYDVWVEGVEEGMKWKLRERQN